MSTIQEIEKAVTILTKEDINHFRKWFDEFDAQNWDIQIEQDAKSDGLTSLLNKQ